ncbi:MULTISPECIES: hypothetical protein [Bacteroides]|nr:hypothetical protein [Bacteroides fragilis]MCE8543493.1 hypothetical protein [Bacteroides fragilis]MCE8565339.1 hypothetical protein [Bacteroides fragilis]MCE8571830.1 hypothetical protein [Bacteroides fragilis]MCE8589020.1 hypothetical protein [Bacteroides fragilis]MCE8593050.1 hypothetical protein [Bacteroides fragilis]
MNQLKQSISKTARRHRPLAFHRFPTPPVELPQTQHPISITNLLKTT